MRPPNQAGAARPTVFRSDVGVQALWRMTAPDRLTIEGRTGTFADFAFARQTSTGTCVRFRARIRPFVDCRHPPGAEQRAGVWPVEGASTRQHGERPAGCSTNLHLAGCVVQARATPALGQSGPPGCPDAWAGVTNPSSQANRDSLCRKPGAPWLTRHLGNSRFRPDIAASAPGVQADGASRTHQRANRRWSGRGRISRAGLQAQAEPLNGELP